MSVERDLQLADLSGPGPFSSSRVERSPPARPSRRRRNATDRASRRAREVDAEEDDEQRRGDQSRDRELNGTVGLPVGRSRARAGERILGCKEARKLLANLVGSPLPLVPGDEVPGGGWIGARDLQDVDRVVPLVLPDRLRQLASPLALFRIRRRQSSRSCRRPESSSRRASRNGFRKPSSPVRMYPRTPVSRSRTSFSSRSVAAVTSFACASRRRGVVEPGDGVDQDCKDARDQKCQDGAGEDHAKPKREGLHPPHASASTSVTIEVSSSASKGLATKRSAPALSAAWSA